MKKENDNTKKDELIYEIAGFKWNLENNKLGLFSRADFDKQLELFLLTGYGIGGALTGMPGAVAIAEATIPTLSALSVIELIRHYLVLQMERSKWLEEKRVYVDKATDIANMLDSQWTQTIDKGSVNPDDVVYEWFKNHMDFLPDAIGNFKGAITSLEYYMSCQLDFYKKIGDPPFPLNLIMKDNKNTTIPFEAMKNSKYYILRNRLYRWLPSIIKAQKKIAEEKNNKQIGSTEIDTNQFLSYLSLAVSNFADLNYEKDNYEKSYSLPVGETDDFSSLSDIFKISNDILSSINVPMDISSMLGENYAYDMPGSSLFQSAESLAGSGFTMGSGIEVPLDFQINVTGMEKLDTLNQTIAEASDSIAQFDERTVSTTDEIIEQYQNVNLEQVTLNTSIAALNFSGIGMTFVNISTSVEDAGKKAVVFSDTLSDIARYAGQIGGAFMNVDENIGKAVMSAGRLTEGISGIFKAFEGEEVNGLGLMSGIQGGFAGLQGSFGGEPGSDTSQLLGGSGRV
jgi:hypothetical protein